MTIFDVIILRKVSYLQKQFPESEKGTKTNPNEKIII